MKRVYVIDNALQDNGGHFFEYDISVMESFAKQGFTPLLLSNIDFRPEASPYPIEPLFRSGFWRPSKKRPSLRARWENFRLRPLVQGETYIGPVLDPWDHEGARHYRLDLARFALRYRPQASDLVFFPNFNHRDFVAWLEWLKDQNLAELPQFLLMFRRNLFPLGVPARGPDWLTAHYEARMIAWASRELRERFPKVRVRFYTDTHRLQEEYEAVSDRRFAVLPIPFRHHWFEGGLGAIPKNRPQRLLYIGGAREEKGFGHLALIARELGDEIRAGKLELTVHAFPLSEPILKSTVPALKELGSSVRLLERSLSSEEYYAELRNADLVYVFYDPKSYYSRSSCIFVESLIAGKPVLVSEGSWMASQLPEGAGFVAKTPEDIPAALREFLRNPEQYKKQALETSRRFRHEHHPDELVRRLLVEERRA